MSESSPVLQFFPFDHPHAASGKDLARLLGGKGASLAEMTRALGFSVPPGFTIPVDLSRVFHGLNSLPSGFVDHLDEHMERLGRAMGRRFGDDADPLLVAVRSGAMISMPGMLDTVLNVGLNDQTVEGLARASGDRVFAWDCYRRFIRMYATTVLGVDEHRLGPVSTSADEKIYKQEIAGMRDVARAVGAEIPADPRIQLRETVMAVFNSWNSARAKAYRAREGISESLGTAVNIQAMVFGNRAGVSGTGVVFTRNPSTGEANLYGDYLPHAQGEDVVSGVARTLPIQQLAKLAPDVFKQLTVVLRKLETHYRDLCDVEFTVESGRLWLLQTRAGKRSAAAAVRIAADLARDPGIKLTSAEIAERAPEALRARAREETLASSRRDKDGGQPLARGLGASPGRAVGAIVLDSEAAIEADVPVILVRPHTSPEDVAGMSAAAGILTSTGGLVSHAAVVAREWGIPAVVGAQEVEFEGEGVRIAGSLFKSGDVLTIDGETGEIWEGEIGAAVSLASDDEVLAAQLPELAQIEAWLGASGGAI